MSENLYPEEVHATLMTTRQLSIGGARVPALKGNHFFVDADNGNNGYSGKSWDKAWATLTYALTQVADWDTIWAVGRLSAPYTISQGLDHLTIIGASHGQRALHLENNEGAASDGIFTVNAKFFTLEHVLLEPPASGFGIKLVRNASSTVAEADYATLRDVHCWTGKYGVELNGAPHGFVMDGGSIRNMRASGAVGLYVSSQAVTFPHRAHIKNVIFKDNVSHLVGAFADTLIERNSFSAKGNGDNDTTTFIDLRNGASNDVTRNHLAGTYSNNGGYWASGSEDNWFGNYSSAGLTTANPA